MTRIRPPGEGDALVVVDLQNDFLPGGALGVADGHAVIEPLNRAMRRFEDLRLPIYATRDWHPPHHCSFQERGGPWPPHCVADTPGAAFPPALKLPSQAHIISKAQGVDADAYSGFEGTSLEEQLREAGAQRLFIGGLATDYCIRATVRDALIRGFEVVVLEDAVRGVNVHEGDDRRALDEMKTRGAQVLSSGEALQ